MKTKRLFEIHYNFDKELIDTIKEHKENVFIVYVPSFNADMLDARSVIEEAYSKYPQTREEYVEHVKYIQQVNLVLCV